MAIIIFQHGDRLGPGRLGATLRDYGFTYDIRRPDLHPGSHTRGVPKDLDDVHAVVILGGEQNVTDIERYPWMQEEAELIRKAHAAMVPIVGICLGAQLIAHALGGQVGPKETPDRGFRTLRLNPTGQTEAMLAGIPWSHPQVFACGQEIKQPAPGSIVLGSTETAKIAAYKVGLRTYGFLFHFECDAPMVKDMVGIDCTTIAGSNGHGAHHASPTAEYMAFARCADRLCVNIATLLFPLRRRVLA
jgi:GMP synthase (glutamine-hydrolysing)